MLRQPSKDDAALFINDDHFGAAGDLIVFNRALVAINSNPTQYFTLGNKLLDKFRIFVRNRDESNGLIGRFFDDFIGMRHGNQAGSSPGSPIIEDDNLPLERFQVHRLCVRSLENTFQIGPSLLH